VSDYISSHHLVNTALHEHMTNTHPVPNKFSLYHKMVHFNILPPPLKNYPKRFAAFSCIDQNMIHFFPHEFYMPAQLIFLIWPRK